MREWLPTHGERVHLHRHMTADGRLRHVVPYVVLASRPRIGNWTSDVDIHASFFQNSSVISDFTHKIQDSYRNIIETSSFGATTWHQAFDDTASCTDSLTCQGQRCKQRKGPHHGRGWLGLFLIVIFWVGFEVLRGR